MTHPCPRCGTAMNHQADKLVDPTGREDAEKAAVLGGLLLAIFACPHCGFIDALGDDAAGDRQT